MTTAFTLNGKSVEVANSHPNLLAALREELDVTSPKDGCSPSGQCGCCTVLIDGKALVSCSIPLTRVAGKSVTTLEGFDEAERERFALAFASTGALQCGFCTPGIVVRVKALLDKKGADLTREDAARHLGAHLCRCTGYTKILDAVELLASGKQPEVVPTGGIGSRGHKYESLQLALGDRAYVDDLRVSGMLHAAFHLASYAPRRRGPHRQLCRHGPAGRRGGADGRRRARCAPGRHHLHRLADPHPAGRAHVLPRRRHRGSRRGRPRDRPPGCFARRGGVQASAAAYRPAGRHR